MHAAVRGYGKKAQDWSYLTPKSAIALQGGLVTDPSELGPEFEIDTRVKKDGKPVERARQQTLVIIVGLTPGALMQPASAVLHLWAKVDWDTVPCENIGNESSSSNWNCPKIPSINDIDDANRSALIAVALFEDAPIGPIQPIAFSFPWLPAGLYKAAVAGGILILGSAIIVEQHTE